MLLQLALVWETWPTRLHRPDPVRHRRACRAMGGVDRRLISLRQRRRRPGRRARRHRAAQPRWPGRTSAVMATPDIRTARDDWVWKTRRLTPGSISLSTTRPRERRAVVAQIARSLCRARSPSTSVVGAGIRIAARLEAKPPGSLGDSPALPPVSGERSGSCVRLRTDSAAGPAAPVCWICRGSWAPAQVTAAGARAVLVGWAGSASAVSARRPCRSAVRPVGAATAHVMTRPSSRRAGSHRQLRCRGHAASRIAAGIRTGRARLRPIPPGTASR